MDVQVAAVLATQSNYHNKKNCPIEFHYRFLGQNSPKPIDFHSFTHTCNMQTCRTYFRKKYKTILSFFFGF